MREKLFNYRKAIAITGSVVILNILFGFDPKFTIINIVWLLFEKYNEKNISALHGK